MFSGGLEINSEFTHSLGTQPPLNYHHVQRPLGLHGYPQLPVYALTETDPAYE